MLIKNMNRRAFVAGLSLMTLDGFFRRLEILVGRAERIPGFGESTNLIGMTPAEMIAKLPISQYTVLTTWGEVPDGWPDQIRVVWPTPDESRAGIIWSMNQDGELWEPFYAFSYWQGQPKDRQAAFVYERRPRRRGNSYVPIVSLHLDEKLVCTKASRRWCDVVRSHPPFRKSPGTTWPYYGPTVSGKASNAI